MAVHLLITAEAIPAKVHSGFAPGIAQNKKLEVTGCQPIATAICRKCGDIATWTICNLLKRLKFMHGR
ncbi:hypothetical protein [Rhizobium sp. L43]|uniref:hypothetical protein n=1 Tax=Rhizobium sp. L43 TaxID=2035452 RepID=UPI0015CF365F|nr:hypothetical protein [Rhizobium sp. L43]